MYGQNQYYGQPVQQGPRAGGAFGALAGGFTKYKTWKNGFAAGGNLLTGDIGGALVDGGQALLWNKAHGYLRNPRTSYQGGGRSSPRHSYGGHGQGYGYGQGYGNGYGHY